MEVLPAIDLRQGQAVRLTRGDYARQTTYSSDPSAVAAQFQQAGAKWIHVVDLDAARTGLPENLPAVDAIRRAAPGLKVELGGGARDDASVARRLEIVDRVVVGSAALKDWAWFQRLVRRAELAGRIVLGLDARDGILAVHGWTESAGLEAVEVARRVQGWPLAAIVYTDIARDGTLEGVNVEATARIVAACGLPVIASGGVRDLDDIRRCKAAGCAGTIVGKAWYERTIDLGEALALAR